MGKAPPQSLISPAQSQLDSEQVRVTPSSQGSDSELNGTEFSIIYLEFSMLLTTTDGWVSADSVCLEALCHFWSTWTETFLTEVSSESAEKKRKRAVCFLNYISQSEPSTIFWHVVLQWGGGGDVTEALLTSRYPLLVPNSRNVKTKLNK